ncbi:MAG: RNA-binding transcriptional accessory protein [Planctomycetia bacterium]|nr:RNA-binding transcriptional accessory protein [Planctomycetia bacterium]
MDSPLTVQLSSVAAELKIGAAQVESVVRLADAGNTVPFITRYRKEQTGNLDEEQIRAVLARVTASRQLAERAATILRLIEAQGKLTPELKQQIQAADSIKRLEDLYLPYKPKKQTRASAARERGLEPLADAIWSAAPELVDLQAAAAALIDPAKDLPTTAEVLQGAADILAERISEHAEVRAVARRHAWKGGRLTSTATDAAAEKAQAYRDYFNHSEPVGKIPPHRALAFNRGESAGALRVKFEWDEPAVKADIAKLLQLDSHRFVELLTSCLDDAVGRLVHPSLEREVRREMTERAEAQAVAVFARNLRNLLLSPPLAGRRVLAIDPGFRTGCKVVVLDENGNLLTTDLIYVTGSADKQTATRGKLAGLLQTHQVNLIAIGNGTACRETEELVAATIAELAPETQYVIVNEAGASIYSTSAIAREEFPSLDATERGTISIGRRMQDPLSELVKIEPQHIGVGMYQHDVDEKTLKESLDQVIESCVNYVGVELNTASSALLMYVSGLNQLTARRIVEWRTQNGSFRSREQLLEVPGIGQAKYTQAAGFLKIRDGADPLDATWIHPESYALARQVLSRLTGDGQTQDGTGHLPADLRDRLAELDVEALAAELQAGLPTLRDIVDALARPGRDPRADLPGPIFKKDILKMSDLTPGMELRGTVLNVVDFGAFVDVGLKESGLVHVSQMSNQFVTSPHSVVSVGDVVTVWVLSVDTERKRVSLGMIKPGTSQPRSRRPEQKPAADAALAGTAQVATAGAASNGSGSLPVSPPVSPPPKPRPPARRPQPARVDRKPAPPAAAALGEGEPIRSFGQLKQLWNKKSP